MAFTTELSDEILKHVFRNDPYEAPDTIYVGLLSGEDEIRGEGYARQIISFAEPRNGTITNDAEVRFSIALEDWGEVTGAGLYGSSGGNDRLDNAEIAVVKVVRENDQFSIPSGNYIIEVR